MFFYLLEKILLDDYKWFWVKKIYIPIVTVFLWIDYNKNKNLENT